MESISVTCPRCGGQFNVEDVIAAQLDDKYRRELHAQIAAVEESYRAKAAQLDAKEKLLNQQQDSISQQVTEKTRLAVVQKEQEIREKIAGDFKVQYEALEAEIEQNKATMRGLRQTEIEYQRLQRRFENQRNELELEFERRLSEKLQGEIADVQRRESERTELRFREQEKVINDQKSRIAEMQRRLEQGSIQLQGEVQELAIEVWLTKQFPLDTVDEIKKGVRGADCIQTVHTHERQNHGTIYYESKRTKDFQRSWIEKFRDDMRERGADIGVLVTDALPPGMDRMGLVDGVWVCTFEEFKGLCFVLRESLIALKAAVTIEENKGEKMAMLYSYLTSNEFKLSVESIVEGFSQMQQDLDSEKRAILSIWKKRERQIAKVVANTAAMHGAIRGIAGAEVPSVSLLELTGLSDDINSNTLSVDLDSGGREPV